MKQAARAQIDLYDMVVVEPAASRTGRPARFRGNAVPGPYGRIFGGQLLGQAVSAASATADAGGVGRIAHSLHATFLSAGDARMPIDYEVTELRDGRSFSVRSVRAHQGDRLLLAATVSFQVPADAPEHGPPPLVGYPQPDAVPVEGLDALAAMWDPPGSDRAASPSHRLAVEIRRIPTELDPRNVAVAAGEQTKRAVWLRPTSPGAPVSESASRAVLAMTSDFTLLEAAVAAQGLSFATPGLHVASLDHALWWHRTVAIDDWILYLQDSPWSGSERGLTAGRLYSAGGHLLASVAQEGLIRVPRAERTEEPG